MTPSMTFDQLYTQYSQLVTAIVGRSLRARGIRDDAATEDMAQRIWVETWSHLQSGRPVTKAWLSLRSQSRAVDYAVTTSSRLEVPLNELARAEDDADDAPQEDVYIEPPITRFHAAKEGIAKLVDSLPPGQRRAIELVYYAGMTPQQAAAEMQISYPAMRQHLSRGLGTLRARSGQQDQEAA